MRLIGLYSYSTALPKFLHHPSPPTTKLDCDKNLIIKIHQNRSGPGRKQGGKRKSQVSVLGSVLAGFKGGTEDAWDHLFPLRVTEVPESIPALTEWEAAIQPHQYITGRTHTHTPSTHTLVWNAEFKVLNLMCIFLDFGSRPTSDR